MQKEFLGVLSMDSTEIPVRTSYVGICQLSEAYNLYFFHPHKEPPKPQALDKDLDALNVEARYLVLGGLVRHGCKLTFAMQPPHT